VHGQGAVRGLAASCSLARGPVGHDPIGKP